MPELPEVETVKRGLEKLVITKVIKAICCDNAKSFPNDKHAVDRFAIGATITSIRRRAKVLQIELSTNYTLMVHLRMTGQLVYVGDGDRWGAGHPSDSLINKLPDKSTRVTIAFDDGSHLYFNDQRKFGWVKLLSTKLVPQDPFMQKVGPEPLEPEFTDKVFMDRIKRRKRTSIKAALLDQTVLAGIGNIYADECLWGAMVHPATLVKDLSDSQLRRIRKEIQFILGFAIEKGGSTDRNYVDAEGKKGSYMDFAKVFRREGLDCPRCSTTIEKSRVAGRGTHTCPNCQVFRGVRNKSEA